MLLPGARILQGSPPCVFAIVLYTPQAQEKRSVADFFLEHTCTYLTHSRCSQLISDGQISKQAKPGIPPHQASFGNNHESTLFY